MNGGVIDLLPPEGGAGSLAQALMEWDPVIRIYESRLWRKNPLFALYAGISFPREYELVSSAANLFDGAFLLDLACGSGIYARPLARRLPRGWVVGLDRSAPMLKSFRGRAEAENTANLTLVRGDARTLPFEDGTFHAVTCCGALHLFPDLAQVLKEVLRVLRPGGALVAAVFSAPSGRVAGRLAAGAFARLGLRPFEPQGFCDALRDAGFGDAEILHRRKGRGWLVIRARV